MNLKEKLIREKKVRWLDIGCGGVFEEGFHYLDLFQENIVSPNLRKQYYSFDIINASRRELMKIGKFDLVRMQHVFEHFSYEEGQQVLKNCAQLLKSEGIILISVPDLRINIQKYLKGGYKNWRQFSRWAHRRIPKDSPNSFYFSIFAHSMPYQKHKWCYDFEGLKYQLKLAGAYKSIKEIKRTDSIASVPFTHNRPDEDVCVMAKRI